MESSKLTREQQELWARVDELWELSQAHATSQIKQALHPDYTGWITGQPMVYDREDCVESSSASSPPIKDYLLRPVAITIFDSHIGVAHYRYEATVQEGLRGPVGVSGRWTEFYVKKDGVWIMLAASGGPDGER